MYLNTDREYELDFLETIGAWSQLVDGTLDLKALQLTKLCRDQVPSEFIYTYANSYMYLNTDREYELDFLETIIAWNQLVDGTLGHCASHLTTENSM